MKKDNFVYFVAGAISGAAVGALAMVGTNSKVIDKVKKDNKQLAEDIKKFKKVCTKKIDRARNTKPTRGTGASNEKIKSTKRTTTKKTK